ncbi:MAG: hypothetical protein R2710_04230 [Acidimicrobiales bacterium]
MAFRLSALHLRVLEIESDPHRRAHHAYAAAPSGSIDVAVALLTDSATRYHERGHWRAVTRECERVDQLLGDETPVEVLTMWAAALDASGLDGTTARLRAFERAAAAQDWDQAVAAALSGLPHGERGAGDSARLSLLRRLPFDQIPPRRRFDVAFYQSRFSALGGRPADAVDWADRALGLATTDEQVALAHVTSWTARHHIQPADHAFPDHLHDLGGVEGARIQQMMAITAFERNDRATALEHHRRFVDLGTRTGDPTRLWHALCFDAMLALDAGEVQAAGRIADEAYEHGSRHGVVEASSARAAALFFDAWTRTDLADLAPMMWQLRNNLGRTITGRAGLAIADAICGDAERGRSDGVQIAREALARPGSMSLPIVAALADVLASTGDRALIDETRRFLLPFAGRSIVVGFGLFNLGPVERALALLSDDTQRTHWLEAAVAASDASGSLRWRVLSRLALADHAGDVTIRWRSRRPRGRSPAGSLFIDDVWTRLRPPRSCIAARDGDRGQESGNGDRQAEEIGDHEPATEAVVAHQHVHRLDAGHDADEHHLLAHAVGDSHVGLGRRRRPPWPRSRAGRCRSRCR